jgi:membrane protease YdiL (CAAX protease family)
VSVRTRTGLVVAITALTVFVVVRRVLLPSSVHFPANTAMILVVSGIAAWAALTVDELGLSRDRLGSGVRWGLAAAGIVAAAVALAVWVATDTIGDVAGDVPTSLGALLWTTLVRIPIGTVVFEELAFRGVLQGLLVRRHTLGPAVVATSALFAVWHVPGVWSSGPAAVVGTVAATFVAGLGFSWLRVRSGSLLAPILAHWATNAWSLAIVYALVEVR